MSAMPQVNTAPGVAALCARYGLAPEVSACARPEHDPPAFVAALLEAEQYAGAVAFLAHALPRREAIWWAWTCARRTTPPERSPALQAALDATERWLAQPADSNRRPLLDIARAADLGTPAGCAALAGFFTGGSIAPPENPDVPPPEFATARAVAGSITLAAVSDPPQEAPARFRQFVAQGLEVARRIKLWSPA
ncbi:MAG TPA: hypothetical protein VF832_13005 [Longimicrobiales bacterium]